MTNDADLVAAVLNGQSAAFNDLLQRYQHSLFAFVRSRVADSGAAEDLSQEVFLAAYKNLASLAKPEQFAAWLFGIARNKVLSYHRQQGRRPEQPLVEPDALPAPKPGPSAEAVLISLLHGLTDEQRTVVLLRFREGLSYKTIAARLDMPIGTVSVVLHRARSVLMDNYQRSQNTERTVERKAER